MPTFSLRCGELKFRELTQPFQLWRVFKAKNAFGTQDSAGSSLCGSLRDVSAAVIGRKFVAYLGFDNAADATKAARTLKTLASPKKAGKAKH